MSASEALELILTGSILEGIVMPYTDVMGAYFYGVVIMLGMFFIYMKTQSFDTTAITGIILSGAIMVLLPESFHRIIYIFLALGVAFILYRVIH